MPTYSVSLHTLLVKPYLCQSLSDFQTPGSNQFPKVPNLHFEHQAQEDIDQETQGASPKDPYHPWSTRSSGCRTQSETSYTKCKARQEDYIQAQKQEKYCQTVLTTAIQTALSKDIVPKPLCPYAECTLYYHSATSTCCLGFTKELLPTQEEDIMQPSTVNSEEIYS